MSVDTSKLLEIMSQAREEIGKVIIGQEKIVDMALIVIFTGQHALIEGVPGIAKTLLVRTLARIFSGEFSRIQFTPDLMPADITGTNIFNMKTNEFTLVKGPVFTDFLLADEINRAPAKTQSALLESMQERTVTIDRVTYPLPAAFTVFATQNPIEYEGTYPLPEAQKDRFMLKMSMTGPKQEEEVDLAGRMLAGKSPEHVLRSGDIRAVITPDHLKTLRSILQSILIKDELVAYAVELIRATRSHSAVLVGASPRATQALVLASRAYAALSGRDFVTPDDIKYLLGPVVNHRVVLRPEYEIEGLSVEEIIHSILKEVTVPR